MGRFRWGFADGQRWELPSRLFLVGMPGAGKSSLGRRIAAALGWQFLDTDAEVEREANGATIASLFALEGEPAFRARERKVLLRFLRTECPVVVATGGGLPCHGDAMERMLEAGLVLYLQASVGELMRNLQGDGTVRPLLCGAEGAAQLRERLEELLAQREGVYSRAHMALPAEKAAGLLWSQMITSIP